MKKILVSGIINIETSLKVDSFHLNDIKVVYPFFGISSRVSGSGMNIAKAISTLGAKPLLFSLVGKDNSTGTVYEEMHKYNISTKYIKSLNGYLFKIPDKGFKNSLIFSCSVILPSKNSKIKLPCSKRSTGTIGEERGSSFR